MSSEGNCGGRCSSVARSKGKPSTDRLFGTVDSISSLRSATHRRVLDDKGIREMLRRTRLGYHRTVAALASVGNHVIMDYPRSEAWRLTDCWRF